VSDSEFSPMTASRGLAQTCGMSDKCMMGTLPAEIGKDVLLLTIREQASGLRGVRSWVARKQRIRGAMSKHVHIDKDQTGLSLAQSGDPRLVAEPATLGRRGGTSSR